MKKSDVIAMSELVGAMEYSPPYFASWCWDKMVVLRKTDRRTLRKVMDCRDFDEEKVGAKRMLATVSLIGLTKKIRRDAFRKLAGMCSRGMPAQKGGGSNYARAATCQQIKVLRRVEREANLNIEYDDGGLEE